MSHVASAIGPLAWPQFWQVTIVTLGVGLCLGHLPSDKCRLRSSRARRYFEALFFSACSIWAILGVASL